MRGICGRASVVVVALIALVACGSTSADRPSPSPVPIPATATPVAQPAPTVVATPAYPTAAEAADAGARTASSGTACTTSFPGSQVVTAASVGVFSYGVSCNPGGYVLIVYVARGSDGWHPYTWAGVQDASVPAGDWGVEIKIDTGSGCVNVRDQPSTSARVASCVGASDTLIPAAPSHQPFHPPTVADGYIWWYVFRHTGSGQGPSAEGTPLGWVVLDYLVCSSGPRSLNQSCRP